MQDGKLTYIGEIQFILRRDKVPERSEGQRRGKWYNIIMTIEGPNTNREITELERKIAALKIQIMNTMSVKKRMDISREIEDLERQIIKLRHP